MDPAGDPAPPLHVNVPPFKLGGVGTGIGVMVGDVPLLPGVVPGDVLGVTGVDSFLYPHSAIHSFFS